MNDLIIYGGAFNPPTIGHFKIIEYLIKKFPNNKLIILPTNNFYKSNEIVSFKNRKEMLEIMCKDFIELVEISNYEETLDKYYGTYYTLKHFNHPLFVIGADSLKTMHSWIKYPDVLIENRFIVFPRDEINVKELINNDELLNKYKNNFIICDDFDLVDASSTNYRLNKNDNVVTNEVLKYIKDNKLYKE